MDNKPKIPRPLPIPMMDYIAISIVVFFFSFFNVAIWVWVLQDLFKADYAMPLEKQVLFATVLTGLSMMRNFTIKENDE